MARKKKGPSALVRATASIGRALTELRQSNAAGKHGKKGKDRANQKRAAIERDMKD